MEAVWYAPDGEYLRDHTIIERDGAFHLLSISGLAGSTWHKDPVSDSRFSHSISTDLRHWTFVGHCVPARGMMPPVPEIGLGAWREDCVWAPHCIEAAGQFWMFYAGVEHPNLAESEERWFLLPHYERICLATSKDLETWDRHPRPVFDLPDELASPPQVKCARDPMVLRDDAKGRWVMYLTTQILKPEGMINQVGLLESRDLVHWTFAKYAAPNLSFTESPFVTEHDGRYYLFMNSGYSVADNVEGPFETVQPYIGEQPGWGAGENFVAGGKVRRSIVGGEHRIHEHDGWYGGQIAVFDLVWTNEGIGYAPLTWEG